VSLWPSARGSPRWTSGTEAGWCVIGSGNDGDALELLFSSPLLALRDRSFLTEDARKELRGLHILPTVSMKPTVGQHRA
jgi:hypothetical protein